MSVFLLQDIETDDAGDVQVQNGDLKLATPRRTAIQMLDWLLKTDLAGYDGAPLVAANFGEFLGAPNISRTHNLMKKNAYEGLKQQGVFPPGDVVIHIEPVDVDTAAVFAQCYSQFAFEGEPITLAYEFPYPDGTITAVDLSGVS